MKKWILWVWVAAANGEPATAPSKVDEYHSELVCERHYDELWLPLGFEGACLPERIAVCIPSRKDPTCDPFDDRTDGRY